jgi:hypothetical protein
VEALVKEISDGRANRMQSIQELMGVELFTRHHVRPSTAIGITLSRYIKHGSESDLHELVRFVDERLNRVQLLRELEQHVNLESITFNKKTFIEEGEISVRVDFVRSTLEGYFDGRVHVSEVVAALGRYLEFKDSRLHSHLRAYVETGEGKERLQREAAAPRLPFAQPRWIRDAYDQYLNGVFSLDQWMQIWKRWEVLKPEYNDFLQAIAVDAWTREVGAIEAEEKQRSDFVNLVKSE